MAIGLACLSIGMATSSHSFAADDADTNAMGSYGTAANNQSYTTNMGRIFNSNDNVPAQATTQEAVAAASLPNQSVINTSRQYQDVIDGSTMFGAQLFRGAFSTTSGSTFNDSYTINPGDNVQVRMWGAYQMPLLLPLTHRVISFCQTLVHFVQVCKMAITKRGEECGQSYLSFKRRGICVFRSPAC